MPSPNLHQQIDGPALAVDTVVFAIHEHALQVLLLKIAAGSYQDKWAVPGGLIQVGETPEAAAIRVLNQKAHLQIGHLEQLAVFGDLDRDVRGQIVSVAYSLLIDSIDKYRLEPTAIFNDIRWVPVTQLPPLAFDHQKMISFAHERLKDQMSYSSVASSLLPSEFTLSEMQSVYEIVWGKSIDKRNFRKKILASAMLIPVKKLKSGAFRPAQLYRFIQKDSITF